MVSDIIYCLVEIDICMYLFIYYIIPPDRTNSIYKTSTKYKVEHHKTVYKITLKSLILHFHGLCMTTWFSAFNPVYFNIGLTKTHATRSKRSDKSTNARDTTQKTMSSITLNTI